MENCKCITLTSDEQWEPRTIDETFANNNGQQCIYDMSIKRSIPVEPCTLKFSCVYQCKTLSTALSSRQNHRYLNAVISSTGALKNKSHHNLSPKSISEKWNICLNKAQEFLNRTTQNALRPATGLLTCQYKPVILQL